MGSANLTRHMVEGVMGGTTALFPFVTWHRQVTSEAAFKALAEEYELPMAADGSGLFPLLVDPSYSDATFMNTSISATKPYVMAYGTAGNRVRTSKYDFLSIVGSDITAAAFGAQKNAAFPHSFTVLATPHDDFPFLLFETTATSPPGFLVAPLTSEVLVGPARGWNAPPSSWRLQSGAHAGHTMTVQCRKCQDSNDDDGHNDGSRGSHGERQLEHEEEVVVTEYNSSVTLFGTTWTLFMSISEAAPATEDETSATPMVLPATNWPGFVISLAASSLLALLVWAVAVAAQQAKGRHLHERAECRTRAMEEVRFRPLWCR